MTLPKQDKNYSLRLRLIKGSFSYQSACSEHLTLARKNKNERGIWQRRFWEHLIRDEKDYEHHFNYIHYNPVKHCYVKKASDWPYSSIHHYIKTGILSENWAYDAHFNEENFGEKAFVGSK